MYNVHVDIQLPYMCKYKKITVTTMTQITVTTMTQRDNVERQCTM